MDNQKRKDKYSRLLLKDIDDVTKIGEGTFGVVYKATYHEGSKTHSIAIKKLKYFEKER